MLRYAFLDPGSDTTFCTDKLLRELNVKGEPTTISLTTMQGNNERIGSIIALEVLHLKEHTRLELQRVLSSPKLPVSIANAATQEEIQAWPHLSSVSLPRIKAEVGLLIGCDAPEALQPREVIESRHGGPYVTRTILGWVVSGPIHKMDETHVVNFINAETRLNKQFEKFCNLEFNNSSYSTKAAMSKNEKKALEVMEAFVRLINGHYEIALPWKNDPPRLECNRPQDEKRLQFLDKKTAKGLGSSGKVHCVYAMTSKKQSCKKTILK